MSQFKTVERQSPFLRQFGGPGDTDIVCFKFWQAVVASGCPGECAYCFLQTQTPYRRGIYDLKGTLFRNLPRLEDELSVWLRSQPAQAGMIVGENQDGLAFERPYKRLLGITPLEILVRGFAGPENKASHTLVVLSKFTTTEFAEAAVRQPNCNVVFSWSLSLPSISKKFERKVAPLRKRLEKAALLKGRGWRVRFRLDAMAPIPGWEEDLRSIMADINAVGPEMLTVGTLRASNATTLRRAASENGRDDAIFDYIDTKDRSGFKYRTQRRFQVEVFRSVRNLLDDGIRLGLCKEDVSIWKSGGLWWEGCHCLAGSSDPITNGRERVLVQIAPSRRTCTKAIGDG